MPVAHKPPTILVVPVALRVSYRVSAVPIQAAQRVLRVVLAGKFPLRVPQEVRQIQRALMRLVRVRLW